MRRNLKKVLALVLALTMVLGMSSVASAEQLLIAPNPNATATTEETATEEVTTDDAVYNFMDGSIIPADTSYNGNKELTYGNLTIKPGSKNGFGYNGSQHGAILKDGNSIELKVGGSVKVLVGDCTYSKMETLTLKSADGKYSETVAAMKGCLHNTGDVVEFNYEGGETTLILEFTNVVYVPNIVVEDTSKPEPIDDAEYNFMDGSIIPADTSYNGNKELTYGNLTIKPGSKNGFGYNGSQHGAILKDGNSIELKVGGSVKVLVGDCTYSKMETLTLKSADGKYSETVAAMNGCLHNTGDVVEFNYEGGETTLILEFTNVVYVPNIIVEDTSKPEVFDDAEYNFMDGSIIPADTSYNGNKELTYGNLTIKPGSKNGFGYNGSQHGAILKDGNSIELKVGGSVKVLVGDCTYSKMETLTLKSADGKYSETVAAMNGCLHNTGDVVEFNYEGGETTLILEFTNVVYVPNIIVEDTSKATELVAVGNGKIDVWDFGAEQFDEEKYNNMLTVDIINSWYDSSIVPGTAGTPIASFETEELVFNGAGKTNHRIRTTNDAITRWDGKSLSFTEADGTVTNLTGYVYSNAGSTPGVYVGVKLYPNDIVTFYTGSNGGDSTIYFESPSGDITEAYSNAKGAKLTFRAAEEGLYKIYSIDEKLVVYRVYREHTNPVEVAGTVSAPDTLTTDYAIVFTNDATGAETKAAVKDGKYTTALYDQTSYTVSLYDANGFVIESDAALDIKSGSEGESFDIEIGEVELVTLSGKLAGLTEKDLKNLKFVLDSDNIYVPEIAIDGEDITIKLEKGVKYALTAEGVNDYTLYNKSITAYRDVAYRQFKFAQKSLYDVVVTLEGISDELLETATITFTNLNEEGYAYTFKATDDIKLRDGVYSVKVGGIATQPIAQKVTANVVVDGAATESIVKFEEITAWDFKGLNSGEGLAIENIDGNPYCSGLVLNSKVLENKKLYLLLNGGGEIKIPVAKGDKVVLNHCYMAGFIVNGEEATRTDVKSGSTGQIDTLNYIAKEDGYVTVSAISDGTYSQTYFTGITVVKAASLTEYKEILTVGKDKEFQTINAALDYIRAMVREDSQSVTIEIDPGNYEEMLVIDMPNIKLVNAAGDKASLELKNKGVDITENAVRITSYYGHGYSYYSMGTDCKYDEELLAVNKANNTLGFKNPGTGTTSGSYWNATVVLYASGFEAEGIIFENSFNQYISAKEANDVVLAQTGMPDRPTAYGDTTVQNRNIDGKKAVERAAAFAIANNVEDTYFNNCKFIGRQDTLYGGVGSNVAFEKCSIYGGCDYIFGGMTAVFYKCDLVVNTDDHKNDTAYLTAPQQTSGRGYLFYNCEVKSTVPGVDTASEKIAKPALWGRPWAANTGEALFMYTIIDATDHNGSYESLIGPKGWDNGLSGESPLTYEYATMESIEGLDNSAARVSWSGGVLTEAKLPDGTDLSTAEKAIAAFLGDWMPITLDAELDKPENIIKLEVEEPEVTPETTPVATPATTPAATPEVTPEEKEEPAKTTVYNINLASGLKVGVDYNGISVLEDMNVIEEPQTIEGVDYPFMVQGTTNPSPNKGKIPTAGAALKIDPKEDGKITVVFKLGAGKTFHVVDGDGTEIDSASASATDYPVKTYDVKKGQTYYIYGDGTKLMYYKISIEY